MRNWKKTTQHQVKNEEGLTLISPMEYHPSFPHRMDTWHRAGKLNGWMRNCFSNGLTDTNATLIYPPLEGEKCLAGISEAWGSKKFVHTSTKVILLWKQIEWTLQTRRTVTRKEKEEAASYFILTGTHTESVHTNFLIRCCTVRCVRNAVSLGFTRSCLPYPVTSISYVLMATHHGEMKVRRKFIPYSPHWMRSRG